MFESFEAIVRQCMLYSLPILITLTTIPLIEFYALKKKDVAPNHFFEKTTWLPFIAAIVFGRAIIFALPHVAKQSLKAAWIRFLGHGLLCVLGFLLYTWALAHPPMAGLPPLHHWWAKVLMYLNLCLMTLHLLPLPHMLVGEWVRHYFPATPWLRLNNHKYFLLGFWTLLAASPLLDLLLGGWVVFPIYEQLASLAAL